MRQYSWCCEVGHEGGFTLGGWHTEKDACSQADSQHQKEFPDCEYALQVRLLQILERDHHGTRPL
jgi:hypothetical protein